MSCAVHGLLAIVSCWGLGRVAEEPRPAIRLVFVEPPPPAPPSAPAATALTPERPPVVEEKPQAQMRPKPKDPERLKIAKKKKSEEVKPEPIVPRRPDPVPEPMAAAVEPQAIATLEAVSGNNHGVIGGAAGGHVGGVIGGRGAEPLPVGQVANPPLLLSRVTPEYPRQARLRGVEGLVLLEAILDLDGRVEEHVKVLQSIPLLDEAAIRALRRWRFRPARDHGSRPVRVILEVPIRFVLK